MNKLLFLFLVSIIGIIVLLSACSSTGSEGFAIYLTKGDISPDRMPALSHVDVAEQPIIATDDIIAYNSTTHEITLTDNAFDRISNLEVPVSGKSFVVCVDRKPIYWGAFWTPVSSISFDGVNILKPLITQDQKTVKIELGYPTASFYKGEDPRNNAEVIESLGKAGKLTNSTDILPHSMKGYELYSWSEKGEWHFTLITGTNRNKTLEEVTSDANVVNEDGWVQIHVVGVEAIKTVLSRMPQKEYVFWLSSLREEPTPQSDVNIMLPPESIVESIKEYAGQCGFDLSVQSPYLK